MRLRRITNAEEIISHSKYIINDPKKYKSQFNKHFGNNNPIHIEIGMGKGKFIKTMAEKYPNINFIGFEKYATVLLAGIKKIEEVELPNLKLISSDAIQIDEIFDKEIDIIYLNFSDPWPKNKHAKRRLTSDIFLSKYDKIFKGSHKIIMKTDSQSLFEYSLESLINYGYKIKEISLDLHNSGREDIITTEYEDKFVSIGNQIYYGVFEKQ